MEKTYVAKTKSTGTGIFAKEAIKKGEKIFVVEGKIVKAWYGRKTYSIGPRWLSIGKTIWISPKRNSPWWFINHSCKPNAGLKEKTIVVSIRNIKKDEELTIDYSTTEGDPYWKMKCKCGEKNCRKIIRSVNHLPKDIFDGYLPFIPKFLQKSYAMPNEKEKITN